MGHAFEVNAPKASAPVGLDHSEILPSFAPVYLFRQGGSSDSGKSLVARKTSSIIESLQHKVEVHIEFLKPIQVVSGSGRKTIGDL